MSLTTAVKTERDSGSLDPEAAENHALIREQLARLTESPQFRNSKRYPGLLRFVVERALAGRSAELKERTLGVQVFGRRPDYDSNLDPVVRASAAETRKRIAQYYYEFEHSGELRIELPLGSYVPEFKLPGPATQVVASTPTVAAPKTSPAPAIRRRSSVPLVLTIAALAVLSAVLVTFSFHQSALDRFWDPVLRGPGPVMLIVGRSPGLPATASMSDRGTRGSGIAWPDVVTFAGLAGFIRGRNHIYQIRREDTISFSELQQGPSVLIGICNNTWSQQLGDGGRYAFEAAGTKFWFVDRKDHNARKWGIDHGTGDANNKPVLKEDFALISRVMNRRTREITLTVAGLSGFGTQAAGQFLTDPGLIETLLDRAPRDWQARNVEVILRTEVIGGSFGPPQIVASDFW